MFIVNAVKVSLGHRTRPIFYPRGVSGKKVATMESFSNSKPTLLLVSDSNARNLVKPQVGCKYKISEGVEAWYIFVLFQSKTIAVFY